MTTLPEMLDAVVARDPEKTAIVEGDRRFTYLELQRRIGVLSGRLHALGVRSGDSVAVMLPNGADFVAGFFAVAGLGAVVVPLNVQYRQKELDHFIRDSGASVLITSTELEGLCRSVDALRAGQSKLVVADDARDTGVSSGPSREGFDRPNQADPTSALICQYSSGSTGVPKRIVRTHANLTFELDRLAAALNLSDSDRFLGVTPFSHVNGLVRSMLASLSVGGTLVTLSEFNRRRVAEAISRERVTVFIGAPFMFSVLAETKLRNGTDLSSLRLCVSASAPMPVAANERFHERFGRYVLQLYGSTETGTISVSRGEAVRDTLDSVGVPIDGVEVGVFADDGARVVPGEMGEVAIKSPAAITEYQNGSGRDDAFRDGYFFTGDIGTLDRSGNLYLKGRKSFFINKGGNKVNPWEVERLIETHPGVEEAIVVGIPSPYGDERVKAIVVPSRPCSELEIVEYCRGQIADFKVPSVIEFRESLPKTPTGKSLRSELK